MNPITNSTIKRKTKKYRICNGASPLRILITAGPTREPIDPVRFITNHSTGTMGYAIAESASRSGHRVTLITGPSPSLKRPHRTKIISVVTAKEMFGAVKKNSKLSNCVVMSAAVADYKPKKYFSRKLKRTKEIRNIGLEKNPDILSWLGENKQDKILVGFCMETEKLLKNAKRKMHTKRTDLMVANRINKACPPFGTNRTSVVILGPDKTELRIKHATKKYIAGILLDKIEDLWYKKLQN
ncbi:MAG: phosphopantothenoylcysteine decarboxylase [Candidatus Omnitrophica bacterium]|nr:phosphopantothenoylcysteine decarboxylase [Candidatus Omnitrophota bacterium]